jgi:preprotein translocase subunit SecY
VRTLIQALKTKELRKKILFVLFIIIVYRIGSFIPTPGVDYNVVNKCMATIGSASQENFIGLVNLFSGGAMLQLSIFALGVMPYITASIVVQLLRVVIPRFEALHKEGQSGEAKLTQYTRYLTIGLAVLQSTTILVTARSGALFNYQCDQVIPDGSVFNLVVMVLIMTGGTGLIMWMAELVTDKGIGQGMSILIFMSICSGFLPQLWEIGYGTNGTDGDWLKFGIVVGVLVVILIFVDFVELCQRRVPVQYTRRMIGRKMYGGQSSHLPIKVALGGVLPIIFASSILSIPSTINLFLKIPAGEGFWGAFFAAFSTTGWLYMVLYFLFIIMFAYFYTSIQYNPVEMANNLKANNGTVPGIRPGAPTADYIRKILSRITLIGAMFLAVIAMVPLIYGAASGMGQMSIGGTSIIIVVGVALETVKQLESQMMMRHYKGFLD